MNCTHRRHSNAALSALVIAAFALLITGCSRFSSTNRLLARADKYFDAGSYAEAEIEYKNVLLADRLNAHAILRLGTIYYADGNQRMALPYILKANDLLPDDLGLRLSLGKIALTRGDFKNAHEQATFILAHNPSDQEAPLLLAESSPKPSEVAETRQTLNGLQVKPEERAGVLIAQGYLFAIENKVDDAEAAFRRAVAANPKSAEAAYAMGSISWQKNDKVSANEYFESAAKLAPPRSQISIKYVEFCIQRGNTGRARSVLESMVHDTPDFFPSLVLLAELNVTQKKFAEAQTLIEKILQRDAMNPEALLLSARIKLSQGDSAKAVADLEHLTSVFPKFPPAFYLLGQAYIATGDTTKAISSLTQATALNPNFTEPGLLLAMTQLRKGDFRATIATVSKIIKAHPDVLQAQLLKAEALRGQGDLNAAFDLYASLAKTHLGNPEILLYAGITALQQGHPEQARRLFEQALVVSPTYSAAVEQLVDLDLNEKSYPAAIQRVNDLEAKNPKSSTPQLLLAKIYIAEKDGAHAEEALLKAIDLNPDSPTAYFLLAQLYVAEKRQDKALVNLKAVVDKDPKAVGAMMMTGFIYDTQNNYNASKEAYEKAIAVNPRLGSALNNLAFIYSEKLNDLEKGFELAQRARDAQPGDPHVADTLGWIVFRKQQYPWAVSLLQESAQKLPESSSVQFHVGMADYMMGNEEAARAAFSRSLQLNPSKADEAEAKSRLSILDINPESAPQSDRASIEKSLVERTDDPVALARLAVLYEREGDTAKAVSESQAALKLNPRNLQVMLNLVRLYNLQNDTTNAMSLAKEVHRLAPEDTEVSQALGRLAYKTGDYQWSYSLFQEAGRAKADDPVAQYELANSAFSVGKVSDAEAAMQHSVQSGLSGTQANDAKNFLDMTAVLDDPSRASFAATRIDEVLKANPDSIPAVMAHGLAEESRHHTDAAIGDYEKVIARFPDFVPAKARLVILYSPDPSKDRASLDLAVKAREAYPEDSELEKALGIVVYRQKDFARAVSLLKGSAQSRQSDPELYYYLGLAQIGAGNPVAGKESLKKALQLGLGSTMADDARKQLAASS